VERSGKREEVSDDGRLAKRRKQGLECEGVRESVLEEGIALEIHRR
jgi:hypothetical protein